GRRNRIAVIVQLVYCAAIVANNAYGAQQSWYKYGGGAPKSALYGIWNVEALTRDGADRPALGADRKRWRRVLFDRPTSMAFQLMDDTMASYGAAIDVKTGTIAITRPADKNWKTTWKFERSGSDRLVLDGELDGHKFHLQTQLVDRSKMTLVSRGFH